MKINKIKLALGLVAGLSVAMPMIASAAADQEKAIADAKELGIETSFGEAKLVQYKDNKSWREAI